MWVYEILLTWPPEVARLDEDDSVDAGKLPASTLSS